MNEPARLILGTRKGLVVYERRGSNWQLSNVTHLGIPVAYATIDPRTDIWWACLDHGHWGPKLQRSSDGETWDEMETPAYPDGAEIKKDVPATLKYLWVVEPDGDVDGQRLYLGTEPGGLFASYNAGQSFQLVPGLWDHPSRMEGWFGGGLDHPGIHSIIVDPRDPKRILVGISCAGVFETRDRGMEWEPRNRGLVASFLPDPEAEVGHDPHRLVACPSDVDVLWQQNHCGIFRSTDGAASWACVSEEDGPAKFGFSIAVDADDGDVAWVVPAVADEMRIPVDRALCVCRTDDGGKSWAAFRQGLPQEECYDIALRHALDVAGDSLAFGTTTGNLFFSDDRGESWRSLSQHLAPIYSVRFA